MRTGQWIARRPARVLPLLTILALAGASGAGRADEPGRFGRFFRFGAAARAANPPADREADRPEGLPEEGQPLPLSGPSETLAPPPSVSNGPGAPAPRIVPQPRVSRAVTDADPLVSRVSLARSDSGSQFGMFLSVYADGTVIDSEGVHHLGPEAVRPIVTLLTQGELFRTRGHCGSPSTDFIENVQVVVYERRLNGLRANAFSYSGNTQGCDHAVKHLQTTLDALQAKLTQAVPARPAQAALTPPSGSAIPLSVGGAGR